MFATACLKFCMAFKKQSPKMSPFPENACHFKFCVNSHFFHTHYPGLFYNNCIIFSRQRWRIWWLLLESWARCGTGSSKCPCSNLLWYSFGQSGEALGGAWLLQSFCSVLLTKSNTHIQPKKQGKKIGIIQLKIILSFFIPSQTFKIDR